MCHHQHICESVKVWKCENESVKVKVKVWKCESESVKVKVWKWKCESVKVKVWKLKCERVEVWKWKCESDTLANMFLFAPTEENVLKVQIFPQLKPIFQSGERVVHKEIQESFDLITKVLKTATK